MLGAQDVFYPNCPLLPGNIHSPHQHPKSCMCLSSNNHNPAARHQGGDAGERSFSAQSSVWIWMLWRGLSHGWVLLTMTAKHLYKVWECSFFCCCLCCLTYFILSICTYLVSIIRLLEAKIQRRKTFITVLYVSRTCTVGKTGRKTVYTMKRRQMAVEYWCWRELFILLHSLGIKGVDKPLLLVKNCSLCRRCCHYNIRGLKWTEL